MGSSLLLFLVEFKTDVSMICRLLKQLHSVKGVRLFSELPLKLVRTEHWNGIVDLVYEKRGV